MFIFNCSSNYLIVFQILVSRGESCFYSMLWLSFAYWGFMLGTLLWLCCYHWNHFIGLLLTLEDLWIQGLRSFMRFQYFLLLTLSKIVITTNCLLVVVQPKSMHRHYLYTDPFIQTYSKQHLPYFLSSALLLLVIFFPLPTLTYHILWVATV